MNDHNLDDLIIDTVEPQNNKAKSFLTIIALIIIVMIVGILFIKTIENTPKNTDIGLEESMDSLISPELTLQTRAKEEKPQKESELSSIIEEATATHKEIQTVKEETVTIDEEEERLPLEESTPMVSQHSKPRVKEKEKVIVPKSTYVPQSVSQTHTPKKPSEPKQTRPVVAQQTYYIQVGSFSQTPSSRFLNTIKKHGFSYKITAPDNRGLKKLLIGPYASRTDANNALIRVKDRINKGAFVVRRYK